MNGGRAMKWKNSGGAKGGSSWKGSPVLGCPWKLRVLLPRYHLHLFIVSARVNMGERSSHLALFAWFFALVPASWADCSLTFVISPAIGPNPQGQILQKDNSSPSLSACISNCNNYEVCKGFYYEDTTCLLFSSPITFSSGTTQFIPESNAQLLLPSTFDVPYILISSRF